MASSPHVLLALDTSSAYNRSVIVGAARAAHRLGPWRLSIAGLHGVAREQVDGVDGVIGLIRDPCHVATLRQRGIKAVNVLATTLDCGLPAVVADEVAIGETASEHLLGLNLRAFAACEERDFPCARSDSFAAAIARAEHDCRRIILPGGGDDETVWHNAQANLPRPLASSCARTSSPSGCWSGAGEPPSTCPKMWRCSPSTTTR